MKNIVLCGFMGCGKTTVGRALAEKLGMQFIDMDEYIEQQAGMKVSEIFSSQGESAFRALETKTAAELSEKENLVISTGGGAVLNPENVEAFRSGGLILLLDVPLEVVRLRLDGDTTRPLLNRPDKDEAMLSLYESRLPLYRAAADLTASNLDDRPAEIFAGELAKMILPRL